MEPVVTAAIISAGARLFEIFVEVWNAKREEDNNQRKVKNWISKNYSELRDSLSEDCVRLLAVVDEGKRLRISDFLKILYPKHGLDKKGLTHLKNEFRYRLEFLVLIGVLRHLPRIGRYEITRLGVAFLENARAKKDFPKILLKQ